MAGILTSIFTFPYAPVRVATSLAKVLQREAEQELYASASVRRQMEELDAARESGAMSDDEHDRAVEAILDRVVHQPGTQS